MIFSHFQKKISNLRQIIKQPSWQCSWLYGEIQPIPSRITPIGWVDLNYKIKFAIFYSSWELSWIWHFLETIRMLHKHSHPVTHQYCPKLPRPSLHLVKKTAILHGMTRVSSPDFLKKCHIQPNSYDLWQVANFILGIIFDGVMFGWIFWLLKDLWCNVRRNNYLIVISWPSFGRVADAVNFRFKHCGCALRGVRGVKRSKISCQIRFWQYEAQIFSQNWKNAKNAIMT